MCKKILLADDHTIIRQGIHSLLDKQPDFIVVGEAENGRTALELAGELQPDVIIMDVSMPNLNGIEATYQINKTFPDIKIIALSIHSNKRFVTDMLKAGASGYILKECMFDELVLAIQTVIKGDSYLSPRVTGVVIDDYINHISDTCDSLLATLTHREREVLQLLSEGKSTKQIASELHISTKTVEASRRHTMTKLDLHSVAELTKYAVREGLTTLDS